MLKFDNTHIFTGYLKQLLSSFNLPTYKVYTREHQLYKEANGKERFDIVASELASDIDEQGKPLTFSSKLKASYIIPYLKDGSIQIYVKNKNNNTYEWRQIESFFENKEISNAFRHLKITNNIYDSYTHEYLGDYLRFLRDYQNLDLMPLYNCFSNRYVSYLSPFTIKEDPTTVNVDKITTTTANLLSVNWADSLYKIYALPVKFFKSYTIAIESEAQVEFFCGFYNSYLQQSTISERQLISDTYKKYSNLKFNAPILYEKLDIKNLLNLTDHLKNDNVNTGPIVTAEDINLQFRQWFQHEEDLKLFIKLPITVNSSIVVLEGDYRSFKSGWYKPGWTNQVNQCAGWAQNHTITNFEDVDLNSEQEERPDWEFGDWLNKRSKNIITATTFDKKRTFKPVTPLTLLQHNTGTSYPFSNKLIEYLSDNVITPLDQVTDNIKRTQTAILTNLSFSNGPSIKLDIDENLGEGLWDPRITPLLYDFMQTSYFKSPQNTEILGYVDKTIDKLYTTNIRIPNTNKYTKVSISNIDLYPEIYKATK